MPNLLTQHDLFRLSAEAAEARSFTNEGHRETEKEFNSDHFIARCRSVHATGNTLKEIHRRDAFATAVSQAAGCSLAPTLTNYIYYRKGDFIGLHRDQAACHSVLLVWLRGPGGPLHIHSDLLDTDLRDLYLLSRRWNGHPPCGQRYFLQESPLLMTGSQYPHHRPPHDADEDLVIASFCFGSAQQQQLKPEKEPSSRMTPGL